MLTLAQYAMAAFSLGVLGALLIIGRGPERCASLALLIAMFGTPYVDHISLGGVRVGVAGLAMALFLALATLALLANRWWLIAAAGIQLISIGSWVVMFSGAEAQVWAGVSFRMIVWMELMVVGAVGLLEAHRAPYAVSTGTRK